MPITSQFFILDFKAHFLKGILRVELRIDPENSWFLLKGFTELSPLVASFLELCAITLAWSFLDDLLWRIDTDHKVRVNVEIFQILQLLFVLGVTLNYIALHLAIFLWYSFLKKFLNCEVIDNFICSVLFLDLTASHCTSSDLLRNEYGRWNINQIILCRNFLA